MDAGLPFTGRRKSRRERPRKAVIERRTTVKRGKPRIVGLKRGSKWKWKVYTDRFCPEFSTWSYALEYALGSTRQN